MCGDTAVATTNQGQASSSTKCIGILTNGTPTLANEALLASFDTDGFTLTFNSTPAAAYAINYYAWGGNDVTNVLVGNDTMRTTAGTKANTAPGFKPDMLFLMAIPVTVAGTSTGTRPALGMASGTANRYTVGINVVDAATMTTTQLARSVVNTAACLQGLTAGAVSEYVIDLSSFDATGFTLNYTTAPATAYIIYFMAIKGGAWQVGNANRPSGGQAQTVTLSPAFRPIGIFTMGSEDCAATNTVTANASISTGGSARVAANTSVGDARYTAAINTVAAHNSDNNSSGTVFGPAGDSQLQLQSFSANLASGYSFNWPSGTSPGVLVLMGYLAFAESIAAQQFDKTSQFEQVVPDLPDDLAKNTAFMHEYWDSVFGAVIGPQVYSTSIAAALTAAVALANTMAQLASTSAAATLAAVETPSLSIPVANSAALTAAAVEAAHITFNLSTTAALTAALAQTTQVAFVGSVVGSSATAAVLAPALQIPTAYSAALTTAYVATPGLVVAQSISASGTLAAVQGAGLVISKSIAASGVLAAVEAAQIVFSLSISAAGTLATTEAAVTSIAAATTNSVAAAYTAQNKLVMGQTISANGTLDAVQSPGLVVSKSIAASGVLAAVEAAQITFALSISAAGTLAATDSAKLSAVGSISGGLTAALVLATRATFVGAASAALNSTAAAATVVVMNSTIAPSLLAAVATAGTIGSGIVYNVSIAQAIAATLAAQATYTVPGSLAASILAAAAIAPNNQIATAVVGTLLATSSTLGARLMNVQTTSTVTGTYITATQPLNMACTVAATTQANAVALAHQTFVGNVAVLQTLSAAFPFFITASSAGVQAQTVAEGSTVPAMNVTGGTE